MTKTDKKLVTHGMYSWLRTGRVNPSIRGHKKLQAYLQDMEKNLIVDLGGPSELTAAKEIIIKATIEAYGAILLAVMFCKRYSILRPDKARKGIVEFQPVLGHQFLAFLNAIRQNLMALGLDRRKIEDDFDLKKYVEKTYPGKKEKEGKENTGEADA